MKKQQGHVWSELPAKNQRNTVSFLLQDSPYYTELGD
jgi:hypothetical protein